MKRKNGIIIALSVLLVIVFSAGLLSFFSVGFSNWDYKTWFDRFSPEEPEPARITDELFSVSVSQSENVRLFYGDGAGVDHLWKDISCEVLPVDAADKSVTWSLAWGTNATGNVEALVGDYLVLEVMDADTVRVKCYAGFEGSTIILTCTTTAGGFSAYCTFTYTGTPTKMTFTINDDTYQSNSSINLLSSTTYTIDLALSNKLDSVGSGFTPTWEVYECSLSGSFIGTVHQHYNYPVAPDPADTYEDVRIDLHDDASGEFGSYFGIPFSSFNKINNYFYQCSIVDGALQIVAKKNEVSFSRMVGGPSGYIESNYKEAYYPPQGGGAVSDVFFTVFVRDTVSGITGYLCFDIYNTVEELNLEQNSYSF